MPDLLQLTIEAKRNLRYNEPLDPNSELFVNLNAARGDFNEDRLRWYLGIAGDELDDQQPNQYFMFGGHRGCGKSTELKRLAVELHKPQWYFVIFIDALAELDVNSLRYSDILLAQAKVLITQLETEKIELDQVYLTRLEQWFKKRIESNEKTNKLAAQIQAGAKAKHGIPFLAELFVSLTSSVQTNSTYKTEIRNVIRNTFSEFSAAFNDLIHHAENVLAKENKGKKILFIVDGTDRLRSEDSQRFFVDDVYQLKQIESNFIYCTPVDLLSEQGALGQEFSLIRLPMVKLYEKHGIEPLPVALDAMKELISLRMNEALFDSQETIEYLIRYSGGHVRDLIRLLNYCLAETEGTRHITQTVADSAIHVLATEYRRLIEQDDYPLLAAIDTKDKEFTPMGEQTRRLLYNLILLEYNSFWWQSHPVVQTLDAYKTEKEKLVQSRTDA